MWNILDQRQNSIHQTGTGPFAMACEKPSLAGAVSQRACSFCGSRVVLYPIADALHLVHGPIGCAAYTWDIRGALSSGPQLHRLSFSTDLREKDVVFGGEKKLYAALGDLIAQHNPKAAFVYSTCIVGLIGDDVEAICKRVAQERGIPVIPVQSEGFKGSKKQGYSAACEALFTLISQGTDSSIIPRSINILGDYNLAGEIWMIRKYYEEMGVQVVATITGDGRVDDIRQARRAALNVVQCSGSVTSLAKRMQEAYGTPFKQVSYFGLEDMSKALYDVAKHFSDAAMHDRARALVRREIGAIMPELDRLRPRLTGKKAAIYVGGAFKAFSLVRALRTIGMQTALAGSQTGSPADYAMLRDLCDPGTILVDDTNPLELAKFIIERDIDLLIGGVKERPIAYKLGVAFCDHNHERKLALAGYVGMMNFAREVAASVLSPVWQFVPRRNRRRLLQHATHPHHVPADSALPAA
jgi:nitrogenase molybdenum-cofactor synthesis protein NifE